MVKGFAERKMVQSRPLSKVWIIGCVFCSNGMQSYNRQLLSNPSYKSIHLLFNAEGIIFYNLSAKAGENYGRFCFSCLFARTYIAINYGIG